MHVRDESRLCSRGATRHSTAALRPCRFGRAAIALQPVNARHASTLLAPPLPAEAVRVKFSGMSFVRSSTESLQPEAFLSGDVGPEYLFPSSNHGWIQLIIILLRDGEESQHRTGPGLDWVGIRTGSDLPPATPKPRQKNHLPAFRQVQV